MHRTLCTLLLLALAVVGGLLTVVGRLVGRLLAVVGGLLSGLLAVGGLLGRGDGFRHHVFRRCGFRWRRIWRRRTGWRRRAAVAGRQQR